MIEKQSQNLKLADSFWALESLQNQSDPHKYLHIVLGSTVIFSADFEQSKSDKTSKNESQNSVQANKYFLLQSTSDMVQP